MKFLKDNKNIVLGYDKTSERGDINFIDASEPKISDFYYNKLQGGLGGLSCFEDGRFILAADKKGIFAYVDLSKGQISMTLRPIVCKQFIKAFLISAYLPSKPKWCVE